MSTMLGRFGRASARLATLLIAAVVGGACGACAPPVIFTEMPSWFNPIKCADNRLS